MKESNTASSAGSTDGTDIVEQASIRGCRPKQASIGACPAGSNYRLAFIPLLLLIVYEYIRRKDSSLSASVQNELLDSAAR